MKTRFSEFYEDSKLNYEGLSVSEVDTPQVMAAAPYGTWISAREGLRSVVAAAFSWVLIPFEAFIWTSEFITENKEAGARVSKFKLNALSALGAGVGLILSPLYTVYQLLVAAKKFAYAGMYIVAGLLASIGRGIDLLWKMEKAPATDYSSYQRTSLWSRIKGPGLRYAALLIPAAAIGLSLYDAASGTGILSLNANLAIMLTATFMLTYAIARVVEGAGFSRTGKLDENLALPHLVERVLGTDQVYSPLMAFVESRFFGSSDSITGNDFLSRNSDKAYDWNVENLWALVAKHPRRILTQTLPVIALATGLTLLSVYGPAQSFVAANPLFGMSIASSAMALTLIVGFMANRAIDNAKISGNAFSSTPRPVGFPPAPALKSQDHLTTVKADQVREDAHHEPHDAESPSL